MYETNLKYVLLDSNIIAGYYLPESLYSPTAQKRINVIIESVKKGNPSNILLFIPNFCIPEVLSVFSRYTYAKWDKNVKKRLPKGLDKSKFKEIKSNFQKDLENGALIQQLELNQYHILSTNLISPIDANYEYYRNRKNQKVKKHKRMMGAADHTIIGMGIYLSKIHGKNNFAILTSDNRLSDILSRAKTVKKNTAIKLELLETARKLNLEYSPEIYPTVINLGKTTNSELKKFFEEWPLTSKEIIKKPLTKLSKQDCELLSKLRTKRNIGRDSLPYTKDFEIICKGFENIKGQRVDRNSAWKAIGRHEKQGIIKGEKQKN